jgi:FMN phosphatase YigB (HAD superfamily)
MAQMQTMEKVKVAGFVDRGYNAHRRQKRMEDDEAEIKRLEAELRGEKIEDDDQEDGSEEEGQEGDSETFESATEGDDSSNEGDGKNLTAEERSFKKRYGDLRRYSQEKEKALKAEIEALKAGTPSSILPPKTDEDLDAWAKKYPDVAAIVETIAKKQAQKLFEQADSRLKDLDKIARETEIAKAETAIRKSHPDFDKLRSSDEFHDWAEAQPKWVQDALYENADDPASVVRVIDLYKVDKGITDTAKREQKKNAAKAIGGQGRIAIDDDGSSEMIRESQVAKMTDKEFEANYDKIIKAQKTGKFIYDISGKAR